MAAQRVAGQGALGGGKAGWLADVQAGSNPRAGWRNDRLLGRTADVARGAGLVRYSRAPAWQRVVGIRGQCQRNSTHRTSGVTLVSARSRTVFCAAGGTLHAAAECRATRCQAVRSENPVGQLHRAWLGAAECAADQTAAALD